MASIGEQLKELFDLVERGAISREEYEVQKAGILAGAQGARSASSPGIPNQVGAYRITGRIGDGGMGTVFRGQHRSEEMAARQGGEVAIKVMHPHIARNAEFAERFEREAGLGLKLDHPGICGVYDLVVDGEVLALVMELLVGRPLSDVIGTQTGPIPWSRARPMFELLLESVSYMHGQQVLHRDIKPENVLVTNDGKLKLLDLGIAKDIGSGKTKTGVGMGTADYMAPEQHTDASKVDHRADIYALGITLYEMLTGRLPWADDLDALGVLQRKLGGEIPPPTDFYPDIAPHVVAAIARATAVDPADRFDSAQDFGTALATELDVESGALQRGDAGTTAGNELKQLIELKNAGVLSAEQFDKAKALLLAPASKGPAPKAAQAQVRAAQQTPVQDQFPCPACSEPIDVSAQFCGHCGANVAREQAWETRDCPMCSETIRRTAKRCCHCHAELGDADNEAAVMDLDRKLAGEWGCEPWEATEQIASRVDNAGDDIPRLEQLLGWFERTADSRPYFAQVNERLCDARSTFWATTRQQAKAAGLDVDNCPSVTAPWAEFEAWTAQISAQEALNKAQEALDKAQEALDKAAQDLDEQAKQLGLEASSWGHPVGEDELTERTLFVRGYVERSEQVTGAHEQAHSTMGWAPELPQGPYELDVVTTYLEQCDQQLSVHRSLKDIESECSGKGSFPQPFHLGPPAVPSGPWQDGVAKTYRQQCEEWHQGAVTARQVAHRRRNKILVIIAGCVLTVVAGSLLWPVIEDALVEYQAERARQAEEDAEQQRVAEENAKKAAEAAAATQAAAAAAAEEKERLAAEAAAAAEATEAEAAAAKAEAKAEAAAAAAAALAAEEDAAAAAAVARAAQEKLVEQFYRDLEGSSPAASSRVWIKSDSSVSKERVKALTGTHHAENLIKLRKIRSLKVQGTQLIATVDVNYTIEGVGTFTNREEVRLSYGSNVKKLVGWYDIRALSANVEGGAKPEDLYLMLGKNRR